MSSFIFKKGFTLVELLVSISIIGLLSAVTFSSFSQSQEKARISVRVADMKRIQNSLEFYHAVNKTYPSTGGAFRSECNAWGVNGVGYASADVIPFVVPVFLGAMPSDPGMDKVNSTSCYLYISNGTDYALLDHDVVDLRTSPYTYSTYPELIDPHRDGGQNNTIVDGTSIHSWKVYSKGGATF